jgi:hypothetical protein
VKLKKRGKSISQAEILNVSKFGIWMLINEHEYFLDYKNNDNKYKQVQMLLFLVQFAHFIKDEDIDLNYTIDLTPNNKDGYSSGRGSNIVKNIMKIIHMNCMISKNGALKVLLLAIMY